MKLLEQQYLTENLLLQRYLDIFTVLEQFYSLLYQTINTIWTVASLNLI